MTYVDKYEEEACVLDPECPKCRAAAYAIVEADLRECATHADHLVVYVEEFNDGGPVRVSGAVEGAVSSWPGSEHYDSLLDFVTAIKAWRK